MRFWAFGSVCANLFFGWCWLVLDGPMPPLFSLADDYCNGYRCHFAAPCEWQRLSSHSYPIGFGCWLMYVDFSPTHERQLVRFVCSIALSFPLFRIQTSDRTLWHIRCSPVHVCVRGIEFEIDLECWTQLKEKLKKKLLEFIRNVGF